MSVIALTLFRRLPAPSPEIMSAMVELSFWLYLLFLIRRVLINSWRRTETKALLELISGLMSEQVSLEDPRWNQVLARAQSSDRVAGGKPFLASMVENLYSMNRLVLSMNRQGATMTVTADVLEREPEVAATPATAAPPRYPRIVNRTLTEAPPDREQLLYDLTDEALATRLWTDQNIEVSRAIGSCPQQVEIRIEVLEHLLDRR